MKSRPQRTVVLTSRENFVWLSMQEIIPFIERSWRASAAPGRHEVVVHDVDRTPLARLMKDLLSADNVVFTCFTLSLCRIGELLRKSLGVEARYFIYLHNQATILCWPFHVWGLGARLRESDVFLSTSRADADAFRLSFENGRVETLPFTVPGLRRSYALPRANAAHVPFVYAGRLSAQKNLHTLIYSFRLLRDANPSLDWRLKIYGREDDLGSPNMGMASRGYVESLQALVARLGLGDRIAFKGYLKQAGIHRVLAGERHVAVSASLHSDENFGMAPFRSLSRGSLAVLTRWGGYADFATQFGARVFLAPVRESERGPWVDPADFARRLERAARAYRTREGRAPALDYYQEARISTRLRELAASEAPLPGGAPLRMTALARRILAKRAAFAGKSPGSTRIFDSYSDPDARELFRAYRMSSPGVGGGGRGEPARALRCCPWARLGARSLLICDPHRGDFEWKLAPSAGRGRSAVLSDWFGRNRRVSAGTVARLRAMGYLHPL